jgi:hypothetical protein
MGESKFLMGFGVGGAGAWADAIEKIDVGGSNWFFS